MLTLLNSDGAISHANPDGYTEGSKGNKGRLEFFADATEDGGFTLNLDIFGNYGKSRGFARAPLTADELTDVIAALQALRDGDIETTRVSFEDMLASAAAPIEEDEAELSSDDVTEDTISEDDVGEMPAEVLADETDADEATA